MAARGIGTVLAVLIVVLLTAPSAAQTPLAAGGLTALPPSNLGPNLVQNPGFEMLGGGGLPASWSTATGWAADQLVARSGTISYRRATGASTSSQNVQLAAGTYILSAWIKKEALGSGTTSGVRLMLDFRVGGINAWTPSAVISGTSDWTLYQIGPIVVETDRTAAVKLENYNNASGTAWFDDVQLVRILPQPVEAFLLYPNFRGMVFDDQPQTIQLAVSVTPPGGDFGRYKVRGVLSDELSGQVIAQQSFDAAPTMTATLPASGMQAGRTYLATISLVDRSTSIAVGGYLPYRVSKVAGSVRQSMNVSFDAKNRVLIKGVPRFVLGVYDSGMGYSAQDSYWESALWSPTGARRMDGLNINMYLNYWYGEAPLEAMNALMANLQKRGVMYLQTGNCFDKVEAGMQFHINNSDTYVQQLGAHAGSAGYYTIDECVSALVPSAFGQYDRLRRLDPDAITFSANFGTPELSLWRDAADIIATDPYPLFAAEPAGGYNHRTVADWTALARGVVRDARPIMTVLQFFKFTSLGRWPTLAEMRSHAYMAIVEGARGLWWWSLGDNALKSVCPDWCAEKIAHMNDLKAVVNEIAALEPALLADDEPGALIANTNASIRTKVKVAGGKGYVFAYNATPTTQAATFTWRTAPGTVTVNAEARTIVPGGSSFSDSFGPFQAHVYVVPNGAAALAASFTSPSAGATVSGDVSVGISASGGAGSGYTYTFTVGGLTIGTGNASNIVWDTTSVPDGSHSITAVVSDGAGGSVTLSQPVSVSNSAPSLNVAAHVNGGVASASSTYNSLAPPAGANNGDRKGLNWGNGGGWRDKTLNQFPDWLQVRFNGLKAISAIDVFSLQDNWSAPIEPTPTLSFTQYGVTAFEVQYWTGTSWVPVPGGIATGNTLVWRHFEFAPLVTDRIRILVTGGQGGASRIVEVEAWSSGGLLPNVSPTISLTAPAPDARPAPGASIAVSATATDDDGTVAKVEFFRDTTKIGEVFNPPYSITWSNVAAGTYRLTARATDDRGASTASEAVTVIVDTLTNVAAQPNGGVASASSTSNSTTPPAGANDGNRTGLQWGSGGGWRDGTRDVMPDWLQVRFSGPKEIFEVDVVALQDNYAAGLEPTETMLFTLYGLTSFEVQYWTGNAWATVPGGLITGNHQVLRRLTFPPLTTDRIRVVVLGALAGYSRIVELEAWGK